MTTKAWESDYDTSSCSDSDCDEPEDLIFHAGERDLKKCKKITKNFGNISKVVLQNALYSAGNYLPQDDVGEGYPLWRYLLRKGASLYPKERGKNLFSQAFIAAMNPDIRFLKYLVYHSPNQ